MDVSGHRVTCRAWCLMSKLKLPCVSRTCPIQGEEPNHWDRYVATLQWRHHGHGGVSDHQPHHCLLNRLFRHRQKKSKLHVTGLCVGNSPVTGEFPAQMTSNAKNVSIWWRQHEKESTWLLSLTNSIFRMRPNFGVPEYSGFSTSRKYKDYVYRKMLVQEYLKK